MGKVCLMIVFNHKYNKNIITLQKMYGDRFDDIFYLVPFYDENIEGVKEEQIIQVYETSFCFQGYFAQAFKRIKSNAYSHYIIISDDQILNPALNQSNIIMELGLGENESYIKEMIPFEKSNGDQGYKLFNTLAAFSMNVGVSYRNEIPSYEEAVEKCHQHSLEVSSKITLKYLLHKGFIGARFLPLTLMALAVNKGFKLPYPLFKAYSDMIIIDSHSMKEFCRLSGVFAAMNIFVETAIPLAMALSCNKIKFEQDINGYYGIEKWYDEIPKFELKYNKSLKKLFDDFEKKVLYYHPVKLSRWNKGGN